ncbi:calcium/sodium antiporter [Methanobacterium sp. ACI-7]|uniref:calcium/sodium antiporter n=1 Tax=unclassified Methanobacterium TaxID=2627676 RepID=UPI0039C44561
MIQLIGLLGILVASLLIVIKAADLFVDNLVDIGESLGISQIILGVTASAIGTSLPEFGSAMIATLTGSTEIGVGVVIGSNIWNIAGILGISAFFAGVIHTNRQEIMRDGMMTLLTALILMGFLLFVNEITRIVGIVLIIVYIGYFAILIRAQKESSKNSSKANNLRKSIKRKNIIFVIIGLIGLIIGCRLLVYSGVEIAKIAGIPEILVGLFALGIGTSAPEFVVTLTSAMKKLHSLSIGTVLGSNVFNIMIGIGVPALFINIPIEPLSIVFDAPVMVFVTSLLLLLAGWKMKLTRYAGLTLVVVYVSYIIIRIYISL